MKQFFLACMIMIAASFPVQASQQTDDLTKLLFGLVVIGIIADSSKQRVNVYRTPPTVKHRHHKRKLPQRCFRQRFDRHIGWITFYDRYCMDRHGWTSIAGKWYRY